MPLPLGGLPQFAETELSLDQANRLFLGRALQGNAIVVPDGNLDDLDLAAESLYAKHDQSAERNETDRVHEVIHLNPPLGLCPRGTGVIGPLGIENQISNICFTSSYGSFTFRNVTPGPYTFLVSKENKVLD